MGEDNLIGLAAAAGDHGPGSRRPMFRHDRAGGGRPGTGRMTAPVILTGARPGYGKAVLVLGQWTAPGFLEGVTSGKVGTHDITEAASR
jgi:hypothetical protein